MIKLLKKKAAQFISWLAKGGNEAFGSGRADCCELNKRAGA